MDTLRVNKDSLMSVLEAFIHDPLVEWEEQKRREASDALPIGIIPYSSRSRNRNDTARERRQQPHRYLPTFAASPTVAYSPSARSCKASWGLTRMRRNQSSIRSTL